MADKWGFQKTLQALPFLGWRRSVLGGDEIEGLGVTGIGEEMAELWIELRAVLFRPVADFSRNLGKGLQVRRRIAIPPGVVSDDLQTALEQGGEFVFHGAPIADPDWTGNCGIDAGRFDR